MEKTFGILIYPKTGKTNRKGETTLFGRITVDGKRAEVSLRLKVEIERWDEKRSVMKGTKEDARIVNQGIANFRNRINQIYLDLRNNEDLIEAHIIRDIYMGKDDRPQTLLAHYKKVMDVIKERTEIDFSPNTLKKYKTTERHLKEFIQYRYQTNDVFIKKLKIDFVKGFEHYLKVNAKQAQSSTFKHIQRMRRAVNNAIGEGLIDRDPFFGFKTNKGNTHRDFLTKHELEKIENKKFGIERLEQTKDMFIFSCYTGISFIDMVNLTKDNIVIGIDGNKWISGLRHKTKYKYSVPILPKALHIIEKYKDHPKVILNDTLLPLVTNQKTNSFLKEIATLCEINKNLTFHVARHTFATTVTLLNGVPIESISRMLGHQDISTTQIYSKIVEQKVSEDMDILKKKLG